MSLDGIRGYAAIFVTIYHAILYFNVTTVEKVLYVPIQNVDGWYDKMSKLFLILFNGETAVVLFFILSGVVLFESLHKNEHMGVFLNSVIFAIKRIIRIYPTLIVCLIFFFLVMSTLSYFYPSEFAEFTFKQLYENVLLYKISMHGASWTIQVEVVAVPFIIISFYLSRYFGAIALVLFFVYSIFIVDNPIMFPHLPVSTPITACLLYFAIGFLIPTALGKNVFQIIGSKGWYLIIILFLIIRHISPHSSMSSLILQMVLGGLFIGFVYYGDDNRLNLFLKNRVSLYLGKVSYSFYLFNVVFLNIFCKILLTLYPQSTNHYLEFGIVASILTIITTIPISHLSEKYLERSSIKFGNLIGKKIANRFSTRTKKLLVEKDNVQGAS